MAKMISWTEVAKPQPKTGIRSIKLLVGHPRTVRFVGNPVRYYKYHVNGRSVICADPVKCPVRMKHGLDPQLRFAVQILDRDEANAECRLKILDVPSSIIDQITAWMAANGGRDPGGKDGSDFVITVSGERKKTSYSVIAGPQTPFTADERDHIVANFYDLERLFKPTPRNKIEARLFPELS